MTRQLGAAFLFSLVLTGCATSLRPLPQEWLAVPEARRYDAIRLDDDGRVSSLTQPVSRLAQGPIRVDPPDGANSRIVNAGKPLTEPLARVQSLSYSETRGEVAFSALHDGDLDIGLVSSDGSPIHWVPKDPADEVDVQWAPRGHKISFVIRARGGDVVRTFHVPTSFQFAVPFPGAIIQALAWEPKAERFAVSYSTVDASDRVEVLKYDGTARTIAIEPSARIDADLVPFAPSALLLRPREVAYGEKLPLVVWLADDLRWNDARAQLMKNARLAMVVSTAGLNDDLWKAVDAAQWIDRERVFVVEGRPGAHSAAGAGAGRTYVLIAGDPAIASGHYRESGRVVTAAPAVVQSVAAAFIADQLKRTTPTNASSR